MEPCPRCNHLPHDMPLHADVYGRRTLLHRRVSEAQMKSPRLSDDKEAAKQLLDVLALHEHNTGTFRAWDDTVQAFAKHGARHFLNGIDAAIRAVRQWSGAFGAADKVWPRECGATLVALISAARGPQTAQADSTAEDPARDWLESKFMNVETGADPNDRRYSAEEMVDAFTAGVEHRTRTAQRSAKDVRLAVTIGEDAPVDPVRQSANR